MQNIQKYRRMKNLFLRQSYLDAWEDYGRSIRKSSYRGMESFKYITCRSIITKIVSFALVFLCVKNESDLFIYAIITVVANVGAYLLNFINLRKYQLEFVAPRLLNIRQHFVPLLILFTTAIATNISTQVDTTMLGFIHGDEAVGYYSIAVKVKNILVALTGAVSTAVFPRLVAVSNNKKSYISLANEVFLYLMILTVPAMVFFYEYAEDAVLLLAGHSYLAAVLPMKIITLTVFVVTFSCFFGGRILVSLNKAKIQLHSVICGTIVNTLPLNSIKCYLDSTQKYDFISCVTSGTKIVPDILKQGRVFPSPEEWLGYYQNAKIIFTNSFHGTVFSLIFRKPFVVFLQNGITGKQNERIFNLLNTFNLIDRIYDSQIRIENILEREIDWEYVSKIMEDQKIIASRFFEDTGL